jgi:HSP20 family protein
MDRYFSVLDDTYSFLKEFLPKTYYNSNPLRVRVKEENDCYKVIAEVPGLTKEDISISFKDECLVISADWKNCDEKDCRCVRCGKYEKAICLTDLDPEQIEASLKDGILEVVGNKKAEKKPRNIEIKV